MKRLAVSLAVVTLALVWPERGETQVTRMAVIQRVTDGDTVVLRDGTRVRLIGVDTPEVFFGVECYGPEASAFTERHLEGDRVGLEFDKDRKDRFGRTLAYIHDKDFPGRLFNWVLVRRGYGLAKHYAPNYRHRAILDEAQRKAAAQNVGIWRHCGGQA